MRRPPTRSRRSCRRTEAEGFDACCPFRPSAGTGLDASNPASRTIHRRHGAQGRLLDSHDQGPRRHRGTAWHAGDLLSGDVILTGMPAGAGGLRSGDDVRVEIEGIGSLTKYGKGHHGRALESRDTAVPFQRR
jgi:hypothetical protein